MTKVLLNICGPTAVGKTSVALHWATTLGCPILSTDSRQCYRELAIGSAPPSKDELQQVPHYFIADRSIHEPITAGEFEKFALHQLNTLFEKHDVVVAVGGSGMYIEALIKGLDPLPTNAAIKAKLEARFQDQGLEPLVAELANKDPEHAKRVDRHNARRVIRALEVIELTGIPYSEQLSNSPKDRPFTMVNWVLEMERQALYERINRRVHLMISAGLEAEARSLAPHKELASLQTVGYREWWPHFDAAYDLERTIALIQQNSRRYAKRQLTYFKRIDDALWVEPNNLARQEESLRNVGVL